MFSAKHLLAGAAAATLVAAAPALAEGKGDRAQQAIAEAQGKIDTAAKLPQVGDTAHLEVDAQSSLRHARELVSAGHKEEAIQAALHASDLADHAAAAAHQHEAAAVANARSDVAQAQADAAQANARADAAADAARAAQADAAAARAQPPVVVAQAAPAPAPTETQVTTETTKSTTASPARAHVVKKAVHTPAHATTTEKTTTTVSTAPQQ